MAKREIPFEASYVAKDGEEMKSVFNSLAVILGLLALLQIVIALFWLWDFAVFVSGLITGLHAYAWSLVGDLSEKVNRLESKLPYGES